MEDPICAGGRSGDKGLNGAKNNVWDMNRGLVREKGLCSCSTTGKGVDSVSFCMS